MKQTDPGITARLFESAELANLLGEDPETGDARIYPEAPDELLFDDEGHPVASTPDEWPRLVYTRGPVTSPGEGMESFTLSIELFVWPTGHRGGRAHLDALEAVIAGDTETDPLFNDNRFWRYEGARFSPYVLSSIDSPAVPGLPLHRLIEVNVLVSDES